MAESSTEEKTEAPSQRRREDARKEGQVAFSREVSAVALLGSFLLLFYFLGNSILDVFKESLVHAFNNLSRSELTVAMLAELTEFSMNQTVIAIIPFFGVALVVGIMSSIVQVGFNLTLKPLVPKLDKLSPLKGFGRIFSKQAFSEFLKSIFKMGVIGYIGYYTFDNSLPHYQPD